MSQQIDLAANVRPLLELERVAAHQEQLGNSDEEPSAGEEGELDALLSSQLDQLEATKTAKVLRSMRGGYWISKVKLSLEVILGIQPK